MGQSSLPDSFYLYLWRSPNSPGTLYLANGFETAEALCRGLQENGYIVKVVHMATDTEFDLWDGKLRPSTPGVGYRNRAVYDDFALSDRGGSALP
jgi:hypothetical protein